MLDKKELLEPIDHYAAERVAAHFDELTSSHKEILAVLFAHFRQGHLAIDAPEMEPFPKDREGREWVVREGNFLYLQKNAELERALVAEIVRLKEAKPALEFGDSTLDPRLNREQKRAVEKALLSSFFVLTGGPGTGKTFTATALIQASVQAANVSDFSVIVTAPTAKAASHLGGKIEQQLPDSVSLQVGTLHRLLGRDNVVCADLIVVDESSMIDASMFLKFLKSIPSGCRVVLIGDKNQLPPVEAGSVFADLIECGTLSSQQLVSSKRTSDKQLLNIGQAILSANEEALFTALGSSFIDLEALDLERLWERCKEHFMLYFSEELSPADLLAQGMGKLAILSCIRKGPLGVDTINERFYQEVMAEAPADAWVLVPLMITANHHDLQLYNSDQGVLLVKKGKEPRALFSDGQGGAREFPLAVLSSYAYNYALSVHKSQGSEYEEVVVLVPQGAEVFGREVLYTAVTRAKKSISIASTKELIQVTLANSSLKRSGLQERLERVSGICRRQSGKL